MAALGKSFDRGQKKRSRNQVQCYNCRRRSHLARNCWNSDQGNYQGGTSRPWAIQTIPAISDIIRQKAAYIRGSVNNHDMGILLDSDVSCSVILKDFVRPQVMKLATPIKLINADNQCKWQKYFTGWHSHLESLSEWFWAFHSCWQPGCLVVFLLNYIMKT